MLVSYKWRRLSYETFMALGELGGNAISWNNYGLFWTYDDLWVSKPNPKAVPKYFLARRLLECKNVKEIIKLLRRYEIVSGFHVMVGDFKNKKMFSIEKRLKRTSVIEIGSGSVMCHSNHYIHNLFARSGRALISADDTLPFHKSDKRLQIAGDSLAADAQVGSALATWTGPLRRPFSKRDGSRTIITTVADFDTKEIVLYPYGRKANPILRKFGA
ncbi:MAG: carcinine hydrolase/isopenicillin-N N-acyltransferase family protein [bacterium]|nr:carcinine hydrolase/isopenicillin-N N-acyltransferase family protein [bacterium]